MYVHIRNIIRMCTRLIFARTRNGCSFVLAVVVSHKITLLFFFLFLILFVHFAALDFDPTLFITMALAVSVFSLISPSRWKSTFVRAYTIVFTVEIIIILYCAHLVHTRWESHSLTVPWGERDAACSVSRERKIGGNETISKIRINTA